MRGPVVRVLHACLSCFYIDNYGYQENELIRQHVQDGHEVLVVASTESLRQTGGLYHVDPGSYRGTEGAPVVRLRYRRYAPGVIMRKLRWYEGANRILEQFKPDSILFHGLCAGEILTFARYAKKNPSTLFYVDSHEDAHNSARTAVSRNLLHRLYYRSLVQSSISAIRKVLCVSLETMDFVLNTYGVPSDKVELFPLGGHPYEDAEYQVRRARGRASAGVGAGEIMFLQTGRMDRRKRPLEALREFSKVPGGALKFVLAGSFEDEIRGEALKAVASDGRVQFLGWKNIDELKNLLCAADIYLQPGTQSATMQLSLCCRCVVVLQDVPSHRPFVSGNGWLIGRHDDLGDIMRVVAAGSVDLRQMADRSLEIARKLLDYRKLANRILA